VAFVYICSLHKEERQEKVQQIYLEKSVQQIWASISKCKIFDSIAHRMEMTGNGFVAVAQI
jgi:hypothetical protein